MKTFNPDVVAVLNRLAAQAEEWNRGWSEQTENDLRMAELPRAGERVILDSEVCRNLPEPRLRSILRSVWQREGWPERDMTREHWLRAAEAIRTGVAEAQFPGGARIRCVGRVVQVFQLP